MRRLLWLLVLLCPLSAQAVNKCTGPDGKVTYSDAACPTTGASAVIDTSPNSLDTSGARQQSAKQTEKVQKAPLTKEQSIAARQNRGQPGPCDGILPFGHKPTDGQRSEYRRCKDKQLQEYRRPSY